MATKSRIDYELNRFEYIRDCLSRYKEECGDRLLESKNLLGEDLWLIDPHTHSTFSDGRGTVSQNYDVAMACGLDFVYITDHHTIEQSKYAKMVEGISWGQEPVAGREHIVLLNGGEVFVPQTQDPAELYKQACKIAPFVFFPHLGGQGIPINDIEERIETLKSVGPRFAMEIMNGIFNVFRSWDECDQTAVEMWDKLLQSGRQVTPVGASDAHEPFGIGTVFTGVFAPELSQSKLIESLVAGNCFVSEAAMLQFKCNDVPMGGVHESFPGKKLKFQIKASDICGLRRLRVVSDGHVIKQYDIDGDCFMDEEFTFYSGKKSSYYRLEVVSQDDRRAFSAPIYTQL
ncbi:MAG: CehA/McbA family metallohydrolase [Victivallales bacterium]|nr:CehA/McbA family metallohydrolase [Victivallales bacterium]